MAQICSGVNVPGVPERGASAKRRTVVFEASAAIQRWRHSLTVLRHTPSRSEFRCLAFAQLTWRERLRDIEACLNAQASKLYRLGFRSVRIARNTLSNANAVRGWRTYADFAQHLIGMARDLYAGDT